MTRVTDCPQFVICRLNAYEYPILFHLLSITLSFNMCEELS